MSDSDDDRTHALLRAAGAIDEDPPFDVARDAVARLRGRRRGISNMNEFFRIVQHLFRGLSTILGSPSAEDGRSEHRHG